MGNVFAFCFEPFCCCEYVGLAALVTRQQQAEGIQGRLAELDHVHPPSASWSSAQATCPFRKRNKWTATLYMLFSSQTRLFDSLERQSVDRFEVSELVVQGLSGHAHNLCARRVVCHLACFGCLDRLLMLRKQRLPTVAADSAMQFRDTFLILWTDFTATALATNGQQTMAFAAIL